MKCVIHLLYKDFSEKSYIIQNYNLFNYTHKHFIVTNIKNLNKDIYSGFENIFYFNTSNEILVSLKNIVLFLKEVGYFNIKICNSNKLYDQVSLEEINSLYDKLSVIDNIIDI